MSTESVWNKALLPFLLMWLISSISWAQVTQTERFEIPLSNNEATYTSAGLGAEGLILYRYVGTRQEFQLQIIKLDTALHENWKGFISLRSTLRILRVQSYKDNVYFLFKDLKEGGGNFVVVAVSKTSDYKAYAVKNAIPFTPIQFDITEDAAFIGGYYNSRPLVLFYNFKKQQANVLPGFFNEPGELNQLKTYADGSADIVVASKNFERRKSLWVRNYGSKGELNKTTLIQPGEDKNLLFGRSVKLANGEQIVAGVYGRFTDFSRGIFVAQVNLSGEYSIKYYNFSELKNFFSYMKAGRQKRIKDRIERKAVKGKKIKFNYLFLIHDIIPYQGQFIMAGEAFYPKYKNATYGTPYNPMSISTLRGNMQFYNASNSSYNLNNGMIFDGYQYTHAVVVGFDPEGKIRWDNSFEINDVKSMTLNEYVHVSPETDKIVMTYLFENTVRSKIIRDSEVLEGKTKNPMKTNSQAEIVDVKSVKNEQLEAWYDNYLYASGTQLLKRGSGSSRSVFFVNKIRAR